MIKIIGRSFLFGVLVRGERVKSQAVRANNKMVNIRNKKIIAREWLILLLAIFIGIIYTVIVFFMNSKEYQQHRRDLYKSLNHQYYVDKYTKKIKLLDLNKSPDEYRNINKSKKKNNDIVGNTSAFEALHFISDLRYFRIEYPQYDDLNDSTLASKLAIKYPNIYGDWPNKVKQYLLPSLFITYTKFSKIMNDNTERKIFYDSVKTQYDLGDFASFESKIAKPTFFYGLLRLFNHLFSRWYWLSTLFSLLIPYLIIQFIRLTYFSIKVLLKI